MMLERAVVDRVAEHPELYQMFPSSEVTPHLIAPHIRPAYLFGKMESGQVVARERAAVQANAAARPATV